MPGSEATPARSRGAPRIWMVHSSNLRVPAANTVQVARMAAAFVHTGAHVRLSYPEYAWGNQLSRAEVPAHYELTAAVDSGQLALAPLPSLFTPGMFRSSAPSGILSGIFTGLCTGLLTGLLRRLLPLSKALAFLVECLRQRLAGSRHLDLIYTRCYAAAAFLPHLRRLLGRGASKAPVVLEVHELPKGRRRLRAIQGVDALVVISQALADDLHQHLASLALGPPPPLLVAPDGVPQAWLEEISQTQARRDIAATLEAQHIVLDPQLPLAVITGSLPSGTVDLLHRTARALSGQVELLAVGAPRHGSVEDLRVAARQEALSNLHFTGPVPPSQVRSFQAAADVLLAAYTGELTWAAHTSPLKLFEYMASGRPMVVSDLPVLREVLEPDGNAVVVPMGEEGGLASGVVRVLVERMGESGLGQKVASRAREDVEAWTWERRAERVWESVGGL